jgi:hypothetical protein
MRRGTVVLGGLLFALSVVIAGCASDRGLRCGGDLVPINAPPKAAAALNPKRPGSHRRTAGGSP